MKRLMFLIGLIAVFSVTPETYENIEKTKSKTGVTSM
jgi:hypothetical protein